jgi:hypothetical protein
MLTILADTTTIEFAMHIHTHLHSINFFVVFTFFRVLVAIASLAFEFVRAPPRLPFLLFESGTAPITSRATCVVRTHALVSGDAVRSGLTLVSESVAHASTTNGDVFDGVIVPSSDGFILQREWQQICQQRLDVKQHQSDVRG